VKRNRLWTLLWALGILFPMASIGRFWPAFGRAFAAAFTADWVHVLMHAFLYLVLGVLLFQALGPRTLRNWLYCFGLVACVGLLHEALQVLTVGAWPGWGAELLDIFVDLVGASLGVGLAVWLRRGRKPAIE
jgi:VanZ family protein